MYAACVKAQGLVLSVETYRYNLDSVSFNYTDKSSLAGDSAFPLEPLLLQKKSADRWFRPTAVTRYQL
jgi:hypothetical protein